MNFAKDFSELFDGQLPAKFIPRELNSNPDSLSKGLSISLANGNANIKVLFARKLTNGLPKISPDLPT